MHSKLEETTDPKRLHIMSCLEYKSGWRRRGHLECCLLCSQVTAIHDKASLAECLSAEESNEFLVLLCLYVQLVLLIKESLSQAMRFFTFPILPTILMRREVREHLGALSCQRYLNHNRLCTTKIPIFAQEDLKLLSAVFWNSVLGRKHHYMHSDFHYLPYIADIVHCQSQDI